MIRKNKRGLSPVVATVLLITMVIVIGLIIFLWLRGLNEEVITKFGEKNIRLVCDEVEFTADYDGVNLYISNIGNVPIYRVMLKIEGDGSHSTENIEDISTGWPSTGLNQGGAFSGVVNLFGNEATIIPVLIGNSEKGKKSHTCEERVGYTIDL
jgi:flagellin-like protein